MLAAGMVSLARNGSIPWSNTGSICAMGRSCGSGSESRGRPGGEELGLGEVVAAVEEDKDREAVEEGAVKPG